MISSGDKIRFKLKPGDIMTAEYFMIKNWLTGRGRMMAMGFGCIILITLVLMPLWFVFTQKASIHDVIRWDNPLLFIVLFPFIFMIYRYIGIKRDDKRLEEIVVSLQLEGLWQQSSTFNGIIKWEQIADIHDFRGNIIFQIKEGVLLYIPKHAFDDIQAADSFKAAAIELWQKK